MKKKIFFMMLGLLLITSACGKKNNSITTYKNGEAVYYDPVTNKKCTQEESETNVNKNGTPTEVKTGCMKWYTYLDNNGNEDIKLILDHNTTARVQWNEANVAVPLENSNVQLELNKLVNDIGWKVTPHLISASDVAKITNNISTWNFEKKDTEFYFDGKRNGKSDNIVSNYAWLFDNLYNCKSDMHMARFGCNLEDNNENYLLANNTSEDSGNHSYSYWTDTLVGKSNYVWAIDSGGKLLGSIPFNGAGVRPVIEISKSILE